MKDLGPLSIDDDKEQMSKGYRNAWMLGSETWNAERTNRVSCLGVKMCSSLVLALPVSCPEVLLVVLSSKPPVCFSFSRIYHQRDWAIPSDEPSKQQKRIEDFILS